MPVFGKCSSATENKNENLRQQLHQILQAKRQLSIQMQHWERIKRITRDAKEIEEIDRKLLNMRMDFLAFSTDKF
jgi:hypothetical protein